MGLTINEIKEDIAEYEDRIALAKMNLANLPAGRLPFKEHKKCEKQCRDLQGEIEHINILISYANEGIELRQAEAS